MIHRPESAEPLRPTISAGNAAYNGSLAAGANATLGLVASGTAGTPILTCAAS